MTQDHLSGKMACALIMLKNVLWQIKNMKMNSFLSAVNTQFFIIYLRKLQRDKVSLLSPSVTV